MIPQDEKPLAGRTAIVTGSSRGIGREIALTLAGAGADVVVAARSERARKPKLPGSIHETAAAVEAVGVRARAFPIDVRDEQRIDALVDFTLAELGRIDLLINNAGALWWQPALDTPARRFDLVMDVNVRAAFLLSSAVARHLIAERRPGHIVMMSPPLDSRPHPGMIAYTISKHGMTMTALGLAEELRPHRIAVNALWPATLVESQATINWQLGERWQWRKASVVADATLALATSDPGSTTGRQLIDEDFLRENGVDDFRRYRCDPEREPPRVAYTEIPGFLAAR